MRNTLHSFHFVAAFRLMPSLFGLSIATAALQAQGITTAASAVADGIFSMDVLAPNDIWFSIETSSDLLAWQSIGNYQVQLANRHHLDAPVPPGETRRFFRARTPPPLRLSPATAELSTGETQAFTALLNGTQNNGGVTWSVVEPGGGSIGVGGTYIAPAIPGTYCVRAVSKADDSVMSDAMVKVVGISAEELTRFTAAADYSDSVDGDALLIMKDGAIVFERYTGTTTAASQHQLASGTKSFSAALFALGETEGLWTLDETVAQTITEWQGVPNKSQITIRQLLSLTSGLVDSPEYSATNVANLDTYSLAINDSSTPQPPGSACIYAPSNFQVLAAMFERKTGGLDPAQYLYDRLLSRLGFSAAHLNLWTRDMMGKPQMAGGARFSARAWANYGKLWIQNGQWQGQTLLNPTAMNLAVTYPNPAFLGYGISWWLNVPNQDTYTPGVDQLPADGTGDGTQIAANAPADMFMAAGTGKQRLYVIPSLNLVIVRYGRGVVGSFTDHALLGLILGTP
jgi:CubicO group peptidase (beta-lactamase class C family)